MGYSIRNNGLIKDFWPDDTHNSFYMVEAASLSLIMELAKDKFGPDITVDDLIITPEHIHTNCLTYDLHDPGDYTNFLCISKRTSP